MSLPTEKYLAGLNAVVTITSAAGTVNASITDGSYKVEAAVDDMSNNQSGGWEEDVKCLSKASGSLKCVYVSGSPPTWRAGDLVTLSISIPGGGGISGPARILGRSKSLTVKGGLKFDLDWKNYGLMTETD